MQHRVFRDSQSNICMIQSLLMNGLLSTSMCQNLPQFIFFLHTPPIKYATSQGAMCKAAPYFFRHWTSDKKRPKKQKPNTTISGVDVMSTQSVHRQRSWPSLCHLLQQIDSAELNIK